VTDRELLEAAAKDAERYRWLRHGDNDGICIEFADGLGGMYADQVWLLRGEKLDAVIDAGIAHDKDEAAHTVAVPLDERDARIAALEQKLAEVRAAGIAAERERCAKLADEYATWGGSNFAAWFKKLAAAIRA